MEHDIWICGNRNKVTVVGYVHKTKKKEEYRIGVARHGNSDPYNKGLGIEIAKNRAEISPYTVIPVEAKDTFRGIALSIEDHLNRRQKQPAVKTITKRHTENPMVKLIQKTESELINKIEKRLPNSKKTKKLTAEEFINKIITPPSEKKKKSKKKPI